MKLKFLPAAGMAMVFSVALLLAQGLLAPAARAQEVPNGQSGPEVQPKAETPDIAPPALPGAGEVSGIATAPKVAKQNQGDPTTELFTAINADDYNAAQDAISRGADLTAQNQLGETPLDLSIALNQNSITFLLLGARNEDGESQAVPAAVTGVPGPGVAKFHHHYHAQTAAGELGAGARN